jgi:hypothetical protein
VNDLDGPLVGTLDFDDLRDHGFQVQASAMLLEYGGLAYPYQVGADGVLFQSNVELAF